MLLGTFPALLPLFLLAEFAMSQASDPLYSIEEMDEENIRELKTFKEGNEELGVKSIDPLHVEDFRFHIENDHKQVEVKFSKVVVHRLSKFEVDDEESKGERLVLNVNRLLVSGDYTIFEKEQNGLQMHGELVLCPKNVVISCKAIRSHQMQTVAVKDLHITFGEVRTVINRLKSRDLVEYLYHLRLEYLWTQLLDETFEKIVKKLSHHLSEALQGDFEKTFSHNLKHLYYAN